jgi:hypothetical protein
VRNEEECVCSVCLFRCNIIIGVRIIKEMPGSVGSETPCITSGYDKRNVLHIFWYPSMLLSIANVFIAQMHGALLH